MAVNLPAELEVVGSVGFPILPLRARSQAIDRHHRLLLFVDLPGSLLDGRKFLGEPGEALQRHGILSGEACVHQTCKFGIRAAMVGEASGAPSPHYDNTLLAGLRSRHPTRPT